MDGSATTLERGWRIIGGPGSPYSYKLRAVLRYRRIPHRWSTPRGLMGQDEELERAGKGMIPVLRSPGGEYMADSTPLIAMLESQGAGPSVLPPDPARRFLASLVEDFADEWLVWCLFDYRWNLEEDVEFCARRQMSGRVGAIPSAQFDELCRRFAERQVRVRAVICGGDENRQIYRESYLRVLEILERMQEERMFLFGSRPSNGDFALYGALSQLSVDPTPSREMKARAPRVFQWVQTLDDASGLEGEWENGWTPALRSLLAVSARTHLRLLDALAQAERSGAAEIRFRGMCCDYRLAIDPERAFRNPRKGFGYRVRCLLALKAQLAALPERARAEIEPLLRETGCWDLLQLREGEAERAEVMKPL